VEREELYRWIFAERSASAYCETMEAGTTRKLGRAPLCIRCCSLGIASRTLLRDELSDREGHTLLSSAFACAKLGHGELARSSPSGFIHRGLA
jgi:hypothetical protein